MIKMENDRDTYAVFNEILLLALNPSGMNMKISPDFLRQYRIHKRKVSLSRIIDHGN